MLAKARVWLVRVGDRQRRLPEGRIVDRQHILRVGRDMRSGSETQLVVEHVHERPVGRADDILGQLVGRCPEIIKPGDPAQHLRSEEHTSELQSLMRISYAVFCLKKKKKQKMK